jgi:hypothetical protein
MNSLEAQKYASDKKILLAFSGGKDAIATAIYLQENNIPFDSVCETSFYFPEQLKSIKETAKKLCINVNYKCNLSDEWLIKNKKLIFSKNSEINKWGYAVRQQRTVLKHALENGYEVTAYGRRSQENNVPRIMYETKHGIQYHPLRNYKLDDVLSMIKNRGIELPFIYGTTFGKIANNAPFYSLLHASKEHLSLNKAWDICNEINPIFYNKFSSI